MMVNDVFLLHPKNRDFLVGKSSTPDSCWDRVYLAFSAALFFVIMAIVCLCTDWGKNHGNPENGFLGGIAFLALAGCLAILAWWSYCRAKVRRDNGRVVPGQVISCTGGSDAEGTFGVEIHYAFVTPEGKLVDAKEAADREDLRDAPLPGAGTAVAVWYAKDTNFVLL